MTDPALFNRLNSVTERLDQLVTRLNEGEGTAGQLLKDKQLYENMNKVTTEISALIAEITQGSPEVPEREGQHLLGSSPDRQPWSHGARIKL